MWLIYLQDYFKMSGRRRRADFLFHGIPLAVAWKKFEKQNPRLSWVLQNLQVYKMTGYLF